MRVQVLERPPPKIWEGQKMSKFRRNFWQFSTLIVNIPGTDRHIEQLKKNLINHNPFHVGRLKFGELWSTNKKSSRGAYWPTQVDILRETTFGPLENDSPQIFTSARDWPSLVSVYPTWDGGPPKNLIAKI